MASDRWILTVDQAKDFLGGRDSWNDADTYLLEGDATNAGYIDLISGVIEGKAYLDNKVNLQSVERVLNGNGDTFLRLPFYPVDSLFGASDAAKLANLQHRTAYDAAWADLTDDISAVYIDAEEYDRITFLDGTVFPAGERNIRIKWNAGWAQGSIPSMITQVALEMLGVIWEKSKKSGVGRLGRQSISEGDMTSLFDTEVEDKWKRMLLPYMKSESVVDKGSAIRRVSR